MCDHLVPTHKEEKKRRNERPARLEAPSGDRNNCWQWSPLASSYHEAIQCQNRPGRHGLILSIRRAVLSGVKEHQNLCPVTSSDILTSEPSSHILPDVIPQIFINYPPLISDNILSFNCFGSPTTLFIYLSSLFKKLKSLIIVKHHLNQLLKLLEGCEVCYWFLSSVP